MEISPGERNPSATEAERADRSAGAEAPPSGVASRVGLPTTNTPPRRALRHQPPHGQQRRRPSHLRPLRAPRPAGGGHRRSAAFLPSSVGGLLRRLSPLCPTQAYRLSQPHKPPLQGRTREDPKDAAPPARRNRSAPSTTERLKVPASALPIADEPIARAHYLTSADPSPARL